MFEEYLSSRKSNFCVQLRSICWLIIMSNIIRSLGFFLSFIMSVTIITVCLFWPTTAYEVIVGDEASMDREHYTIVPEFVPNVSMVYGYRNDKTGPRQLLDEFKNYLNNTKYIFNCTNEVNCEVILYDINKRWYDEFHVDPFPDIYASYVSLDADSQPQILFRVPYYHVKKIKRLMYQVLPFHMFLQNFIIKYLNSSNLANIKLKFGIFESFDMSLEFGKPNPLAQFSTAVVAAHEYLGITCMIIHMSSSMVSDKETGMRPLMSIMGMQRLPYLLGYTIIYFIIILIFCGYGTIIIIIEPTLIVSGLRTMFTFFKMFVNYIGVGLLILAQSFLMHTITRSVRIITFVVLLAHCLQMIVGITILKFQLEEIAKKDSNVKINWINYIFPVIAFFNAQIEICTGTSATLETDQVWTKIIFVFCVAVGIFLIGIYLDFVLDTGTGHSYPLLFIFTFIMRKFSKENKYNMENYNNENVFETEENYMEAVNQKLVRVRLQDVQKIFHSYNCCKREEVNAVQNVTLSLQEGMITAILGHNGAGKTTTFNILVGLLQASNGYVNIYGLNPNNPWDKDVLNRMTSICMQSDILFPNLTCMEHIKLFGVFKGLSNTDIIKEINALFTKLDLINEKNKRTKILSGGQMRKLCVAIALLGNPKIVLFDEPTSGVDPISRRCIWNALKDYKADKIMILSTHYMDEADILADWKAIMVKGRIVCYGTSMFLKKKFNLGYVFSCTLDSTVTDISNLLNLIRTHAQSSEFKKRHGMEVTFKISSTEIIKLCQYISSVEGSEKMKKIGVIDYGISVTKLEEIFLKLGEIEMPENNDDNLNKIINTDESNLTKRTSKSTKEDINLEEIMTLETIQKLQRQSDFIIGFYQFWTFIRLNILLSIRSPVFATLRTIGPVCTIALAAVLFWFESSRKVDFAASGQNVSIIRDDWSPYIFYLRLLDKDRVEFTEDLLCIRRMYGERFIFTNETPDVLAIKGSTHLNITSWNKAEGYHLDYVYSYKFMFGFMNIFQVHTLLNNCLLNRLMGIKLNESIKYYFLADTWNIKWTEVVHPSFSMLTAFVYMMALSVSFSLMNPVISGDVVRDRMLGNLSQMTLYGLKFLAYWASHFMLHFIHYVMIMCIIIIFMCLANNYLFIDIYYLLTFVLIYLLASVDTILVIYCLSVAFTDIATAEIAFSFSILIPLFLMSVLIFCPLDLQNSVHVIFVSLFPFLNPWITLMLLDFATRKERQDLFNTFDIEHTIDSKRLFSLPAVFHSVIIHVVHIILLSILFVGYNTYVFVIRPRMEELALIQIMRKRKKDGFMNSISTTMEGFALHATEDLEKYRNLVDTVIESHDQNEDIIAVIGDMTKIYQTSENVFRRKVQATVALSNVNLVVNKGEVFGLLGPSGAGKSTAMNCTAYLSKPSSGKVVVYDPITKTFLSASIASSRNMIGLCPQNNPIWPTLTVNEHLLIYAALRGIPRKKRKEHAANLIKLVNLKLYTNTIAGSLSGGCKRRLSMAISFTGNPNLILLDEPSCGVDPKSRRNLWDTISSAIHNTNKGAIITTQFMEECEALCNRLGILINGRIMCIGSPQELKSKFGRGISVEIKIIPGKTIKDTLEIKMQLTQYLLEFYPKLLTVENFGERLTYRIPKSPDINFGKVFEVIHEAKNKFEIEDYAVSQPTLEQVYFDFAKYQSKNDLQYDIEISWK